MSRAAFVTFKDFEHLDKLSIFCSTLKVGDLINIETLTDRFARYRVWYYAI